MILFLNISFYFFCSNLSFLPVFLHLKYFSVCFVIVFINPIEYILLCSCFPALSCPVDFIILLFIYFPAAVISKNKLT